MRVSFAVIALALIVAISSTGCSRSRPDDGPVQVPAASNTPVKTATPAPATSTATTPEIAGNQGALSAALAENSAVRYEIVVSGEPASADKDEALDKLLQDRKWPEAPMMVLMVFPSANHDIRFALGTNFNQKKVAVDEILTLVRSAYFTKVREGDPAAGLAELVRAVNQRMAQ